MKQLLSAIDGLVDLINAVIGSVKGDGASEKGDCPFFLWPIKADNLVERLLLQGNL